ncbi:MAG: GNAT family N-acetyltransferase [Mucilaginibacter sp.]
MALNDTITLKRTNSSDPDFLQLIILLDKELHDIYGDLQSTYDRYNQMNNLDTVLIAYRDDLPVGCGCFKQIDDTTVEIKRMFVKPAERGKGSASRLLAELEIWAKGSGFSQTILETGKNQQEALSLYKKAGYSITPNYGQYSGMDSSICFAKRL